MPNLLRNILATIAGIFFGGGVNGMLIKLSPSLIPPPAGVDVTKAESLATGIHLFEPRHFIMPFLAHALGTLVGAILAHLIAATNRNLRAYVIGLFFLVGGIVASMMIPAPTWFKALDLIVAYIPMAWLGAQIGNRVRPDNDTPTPQN